MATITLSLDDLDRIGKRMRRLSRMPLWARYRGPAPDPAEVKAAYDEFVAQCAPPKLADEPKRRRRPKEG